nr:RES family NAD+ phosphorylase [Paenibacillus periandrae]
MFFDFSGKYGHDLLGKIDGCHVITKEGKEKLSCTCCNEDIIEEDSYFILTIEDDILNDIADQVGADIGGCTYCEGEERGHFVHAFNNDPHDPSSRMEQPEGITLSEYFFDKDVPEELYQLLCTHIQCPCGHGRDAYNNDNSNRGIFEIDDDIYTKRDVADYWGFQYEEFCAFSQSYGVTIEKDDLNNFRTYLSRYPMLALKHPVGKAIYQTLEKHFEARDFSLLTPKVGTLYRGRTRKRDTPTVLTKEQMWAPPQGHPQHGRYNSIGVPVLYVADRLDAIPYEIHPTHEDVLDIGEFQILRKELHLFDLGSFDPTFQGFFNEMNEETKILKQAYLLPNFIGTCCSFIGYHGVRYEGVHDKELTYTNYALFNIEPGVDIQVRDVICYAPQFTITLEEIPQFTKRSPTDFF